MASHTLNSVKSNPFDPTAALIIPRSIWTGSRLLGFGLIFENDPSKRKQITQLAKRAIRSSLPVLHKKRNAVSGVPLSVVHFGRSRLLFVLADLEAALLERGVAEQRNQLVIAFHLLGFAQAVFAAELDRG